MGQSILRYRRKPFRSGVDVRPVTGSYYLNAFDVGYLYSSLGFEMKLHLPKGNRVNIPEPGIGYWCLVFNEAKHTCGNANELGDADTCPRKSCLFFIRHRLPGIGSSGDREMVTVEHRGSCGVWCARVGP